ncbi:4Fe-4S dicluster domain-containing protein [Sulfolobus sp. S-194]|uniref:4Fe-4S binding protein n=1 Tax=Sulfolobus sp. S-194 TaxID=2512240 RepID=UPI00143708E5|nr:4Fe-4S binding protein [Sulfolobus sp. S-194]QIW24428.1 4Fe-4S dicluster domain-containing protein [Sulfolobus sp. S-194]
MKIKFYRLNNAEEIAKEVMSIWPIYLPKPKIEIVNEITCDSEPFILVGKDEKLDCAYFQAKPEPKDIITKAIELNFALTEKTTSARTLLTGKMTEKFVKSPIVNENCLAPFGCIQCVTSCPFNAINIVDGKISINAEKCTNCGLCTSSCPIGAINLSYPNWSAITLLTKFRNKGEKIKVSCRDADLIVPCIGVLGPEELFILQSLYDVELFCSNDECVNKKIAEKTMSIFDEVKEKIPKEKPSINLSGIKRKDYTKVVTSLRVEGKAVIDIHAYRAVITEECTLCGVCVRRCPTKALEYEIKESKVYIKFSPANCVGCNMCVNLCEEGAIYILKDYNYQSLNEDYSYILTEDEIVKCRRCGKPFDNKKRILRVAKLLNKPIEELEYCNECKQLITSEDILKNWKAKFGEIRRSKT